MAADMAADMVADMAGNISEQSMCLSSMQQAMLQSAYRGDSDCGLVAAPAGVVFWNPGRLDFCHVGIYLNLMSLCAADAHQLTVKRLDPLQRALTLSKRELS